MARRSARLVGGEVTHRCTESATSFAASHKRMWLALVEEKLEGSR